MRKITDIDNLAGLYGQVSQPAIRKVAHKLTPLYHKWIVTSRFCIVSTVGAAGTDGSPRGDDGPVVRVHDARTLLMPDWRGNNRLDTLRNIVEDGRISLLFMVPPSNTVVRVNGRAWLTDDPEMRESFEQKGRHPATVIVIEIGEIYTQCAKALIRSGLWGRQDTDGLPTTGEILADMTNGEEGGKAYDINYPDYAQTRLW